MSSIVDTVEGGVRLGKLKERLKQVEHDLWNYLDDQENYLNDDDLLKEKADVHYLEGKREGLEGALMAFYDVDDVEKIYNYDPRNKGGD